MTGSDCRSVSAPILRDFAIRALCKVGMPPDSAADTAEAMIWGDLHGLQAHGVVRRLAQCLSRIQEGGTRANARITAVGQSGALSVVDANNAWGQLAAVRAMRLAVSSAKEHGIAAVAVRNTGSPAALGYYPTLAIEAHMIGIAATNCPALISAPGGTRRVLGNQAHAVGCPSGEYYPILYDSALTQMSTGEMDRRRESGEALPPGVLADEFGQPTIDPGDWVRGLLTPIGGHRGFGLALSIEILTAVLAGSDKLSVDVSHPFDFASPQGVSLFCLAIDPTVAGSYEKFLTRVDRLIEVVHSSAPASRRSRLPGERGYELAARREQEGIPISSKDLTELRNLGIGLGIDAP